MKKIIYPKCPYCHKEYKPSSMFSNKFDELSVLYGQFCSDTVSIKCPSCSEIYYVSEQTRFIARKKK